MKKVLIAVLVFALLLLSAGCQSAFGKQYTEESRAKIPPEDALSAALEEASLTGQEITDLDVELDRDKSGTHYDVDFEKDGKEYAYEIHAETGEILNQQTPKTTTATGQITRQQAIDIALAHAGLTTDQIRDLDAEKDKERGVWLYEVDFEQGAYEYEYEIHTETGEILKAEKELD